MMALITALALGSSEEHLYMGEQLDAVGPELGPNSCKKQPEMITGPWVQLCLHFPERE